MSVIISCVINFAIKVKTHVLFSFLNLSIHGAMTVLPVTFDVVNALNLFLVESNVADYAIYSEKHQCFSQLTFLKKPSAHMKGQDS
jgi:hypothetical protein